MEELISPHGDVRVFDASGNLKRIDKVADHQKKKGNGGKNTNMFRCKICKHTLNLQLVCEVCHGRQRNVQNQKEDLERYEAGELYPGIADQGDQ